MIKNFGTGSKWIPGVVVRPVGKAMYEVQTAKGVLRRHQNQIRRGRTADKAVSGRLEPEDGEDCVPVPQAEGSEPPKDSNGKQQEPKAEIADLGHGQDLELQRSARQRKPRVTYSTEPWHRK